MTILDSLDFVNTRVSAVAQFLDYYEITKDCGTLVGHFVRLAEWLSVSTLL